MKIQLTLFTLGLVIAGTAMAQPPHATQPTLPMTFTAPLTFVKLLPPAGVEATFYQGRSKPRTFPTPVVVGMRPGYLHRLKLDKIPDHKGLALYPTIEVRGSLKLIAKFAANNFPATVRISPEDIEAAIKGTLVTKVIYLEHPDRAEPRATTADDILELDVPRENNPFDEARLKGRVMLVVHLGERSASEEELSRINVPGTILFPGEKVVGPAAIPPIIPNGLQRPFFDPLNGPAPLDEECLHDGGDRLAKAAFDLEGNLAGLDPEDTVAEYRDSAGVRRLTCSNRVCLCVPRFVSLRKECPLALTEGQIGLASQRAVHRDFKVENKMKLDRAIQSKRLHAYDGKTRPSVNIGIKGPGLLDTLIVLDAQKIHLGPAEKAGTKELRQLTTEQKTMIAAQVKLTIEYSQSQQVQQNEGIKGVAVVARYVGAPEVIETSLSVRDLTVCCSNPPEIPEKPLCLFKCADRGSAKPGDIVTFYLRYSNLGGRAMTDVAVSDSLSGRLEYVEGSAEADREAVFTTQENEAGSKVLRWEISGKLLPGQSGRVKFKAKVR
jgi:uncharacterized repeat protein (TIGR01451 family)